MAPIRHLLSRRWLQILLLAVLVPAAVFAGCEIAGWPFLQQPLEDFLARRLERSVRIAEPFRLRFLGSLRLQAGGLWIDAPPDFRVPHFIDARGIELKLRYRDLLAFRRSGILRIAALDLQAVDARLVRAKDGGATWQFGPRQPGKPPPELPRIDFLAIRQGSIHFQDPGLETELRALFDTREGAGTTAPVSHLQATGRYRGRPFTGQLTTRGSLPAATREAETPPLAARGWLDYGGVRADFNGQVSDLFGRRGIHGTVAIHGPSLGLLGQLVGSPLPTTAPFTLAGRVDKEDEAWRVVVDSARVGKSDLSARFTYDPGREPPRLTGELTGRRLVLADLAPAFGTRNREGKPVPRRPGHLFPDRRLNLPALKNLEAHIEVNLDHVDLGNAFREHIEPLKATLSLEQGQLGLARLDARTARGRLSGNISVDARPANPRWESDLAWEGIRLQDWLKGAKSADRGGKGEPPAYFTGLLQGRARLTGAGSSTAELLGSLDGEILMSVKGGSLSHLVIEILGLDVAQGLGLAISGDKALPVNCAVVDLQARNGDLTPQVALIDTPVTLILADGTIDLSRERLNLRLTAKPKNISPFTLRSPIRVQGSFVDPAVTPEPGPIAGKVLGSIALAIISPLAAILPFLDPGEGEGSPCARALANLKK